IRDLIVTGVQTCALPISATVRERARKKPARVIGKKARMKTTVVNSIGAPLRPDGRPPGGNASGPAKPDPRLPLSGDVAAGHQTRSEERRVGKGWRSRWAR